MSYCEYVKKLDKDHVSRIYHDEFYGVNIEDDNELFSRLIMEINQAGLSWETILKKEKGFRKAYKSFDIKKIADFNDKDIERLLSDQNIIRNKLKVNAAIYNAKNIIRIKSEKYFDIKENQNKNYKSFYNWIHVNDFANKNKFKDLKDIVKFWKKEGFVFVGGEILNEFLMSVGVLGGAHDKSCKYFKR